MMSDSTGEQLRLLIERVERLSDERQGIADDIKEVYAEAKARGYDPKIIRKVVALRKRKQQEVEEEHAILETYLSALNMQLSFL